MAFRYRREGQFTKFRVHFDRSGFRPYIDELKWEIMDWHYQRALGPQMKKSLMSYQAGKAKKTASHFSQASRRESRPYSDDSWGSVKTSPCQRSFSVIRDVWSCRPEAVVSAGLFASLQHPSCGSERKKASTWHPGCCHAVVSKRGRIEFLLIGPAKSYTGLSRPDLFCTGNFALVAHYGR